MIAIVYGYVVLLLSLFCKINLRAGEREPVAKKHLRLQRTQVQYPQQVAHNHL